MTISVLAGFRGLNFVSVEVTTSVVLEAGSRMKIEAPRDRARVKKWALEVAMGSKKAAHAYLKGLETANKPALLREDRRDGETLFDPDASVQMRADEWDRIWLRDKAELPLPRLYQALHACRAEAAKADHARLPMSEHCCTTKEGSPRTIGRLLSSQLARFDREPGFH